MDRTDRPAPPLPRKGGAGGGFNQVVKPRRNEWSWRSFRALARKAEDPCTTSCGGAAIFCERSAAESRKKLRDFHRGSSAKSVDLSRWCLSTGAGGISRCLLLMRLLPPLPSRGLGPTAGGSGRGDSKVQTPGQGVWVAGEARLRAFLKPPSLAVVFTVDPVYLSLGEQAACRHLDPARREGYARSPGTAGARQRGTHDRVRGNTGGSASVEP